MFIVIVYCFIFIRKFKQGYIREKHLFIRLLVHKIEETRELRNKLFEAIGLLRIMKLSVIEWLEAKKLSGVIELSAYKFSTKCLFLFFISLAICVIFSVLHIVIAANLFAGLAFLILVVGVIFRFIKLIGESPEK